MHEGAILWAASAFLSKNKILVFPSAATGLLITSARRAESFFRIGDHSLEQSTMEVASEVTARKSAPFFGDVAGDTRLDRTQTHLLFTSEENRL